MRCELEGYSQLKILSLLLFFIVEASSANVASSFRVNRQSKILKSYGLKDACLKHFQESPLLANIEEKSMLNCMGKTFNPRFLCKGEKIAKSLFTRAIISEDNTEVICEFSSFVKLNLNCSHPLIKSDCSVSPRQACTKLARSYAHDLTLVHSSKIKDGDKFLVDCHYSR